MKAKSLSLDDILAKELKDDVFKLLFDQRRFYLQIAHLISDLRAPNRAFSSRAGKEGRSQSADGGSLRKG